MIEVAPASSFLRAYRKRVQGDSDLEQRFAKALALFVENPYEPRPRTHKLTGELDG